MKLQINESPIDRAIRIVLGIALARRRRQPDSSPRRSST